MIENKLEKSKHIKRVTAIGKLAGKIAAPVLGKRGFAEVDILTKWEEIVGAELAAHISPVKISFQKNKKDNGTLHVRTAGSAYATELQHKTPRVIER
ncbi:MAG: DUF721 domain-containing protein, partial [Alphaproteobacteria bacterium]|nr:DUF721 domain-containing protein [Alphaproteobacteria bacterium]